MTPEQQATLFSAASVEWLTPLWLFRELDDQFHFGLDVASTDGNCLVPHHFTREVDALQRPWDRSFFCNPPYGNSEEPCGSNCKKKRCVAPRGKKKDQPPRGHVSEYQAGCLDFAQYGVAQARAHNVTGVYLVPARTDTEWFGVLWRASQSVLFVEGRLCFEQLVDGKRVPMDPAPFPSVLFEVVPNPPLRPDVALWNPRKP